MLKAKSLKTKVKEVRHFSQWNKPEGYHQMDEICLDTSTYSLPGDVIPSDGMHKEKLKDQRAMMKIRQLVVENKIKLFIPTNVHLEFRKLGDDLKKSKLDKFWQGVKINLLPQEIGFDGIQLSLGRNTEYQKAVDEKEAQLTMLKDSSLDSSILLNSWFFGKTVITTDYNRIRKIRRQLGSTVNVLRPSEFVVSIKKRK